MSGTVRRAAAIFVWGLIGTAGCTPLQHHGPPSPPMIPDPELPLEAPLDLRELPAEASLEPPADPLLDPILHSRWANDPAIAERVSYWTEVFSTRDAQGFATWLERMERYRPIVDSTLAANALPGSLRYLPIIESGYLTGAVSRAAAVGIWQFIAPSARGQGLVVSSLVDERRDPVRSTAGAAAFLEELHGRFGSWFLALAAYNGGPNRVERLLREHAPLAAPSDSLFFVIAPHLPRETRDYVPKFLAAARVAEQPHQFGIAPVPPESIRRYAVDEVTVPDAASLDVIARAAGVEEDEIRALNPHVLRGVTPRGEVTALRVPQGTGARFETEFAKIPANERVTVTEHVVAQGETLSAIARRYGIRLAELQGANPSVDPRRMRVGTRLLVPLLPGAARRGTGSLP